jgi:hypothetical protein
MSVIHATRRTAALLLVFAFVGVGCSRGGSGDPTAKAMVARGNNSGRFGVITNPATGVKTIATGSWKCTAKIDKDQKLATTDCTGKSTDGKAIALHAVSTFEELKKRRQRALPGKITITVDGVVKATATCVGKQC